MTNVPAGAGRGEEIEGLRMKCLHIMHKFFTIVQMLDAHKNLTITLKWHQYYATLCSHKKANIYP